MVDFLVAAMQGVCIFGLVCGAYFAISYGEQSIPVARAERFDPVTTHSWTPADRTRGYARG